MIAPGRLIGSAAIHAFGDPYQKRQHPRHALLERTKAVFDCTEPGFHNRKALFESAEALFERTETHLQVAHVRGQRHNPRAQ